MPDTSELQWMWDDGCARQDVQHWKTILTRGGTEEVLQAGTDALERVLAVAARADRMTLQTEAEFCNACNRILQALERFFAHTPAQTRIFVGTEERTQAYAGVCRLLGTVEEDVHTLRGLSLRAPAVEACRAEQSRAVSTAEQLFFAIRRAAQECGAEEIGKAVAVWDARLAEAKERIIKWKNKEITGWESIVAFCRSVLSDFDTRLQKEGDFEHDGRDCNPAAVLRLCGELQSALQRQLTLFSEHN